MKILIKKLQYKNGNSVNFITPVSESDKQTIMEWVNKNNSAENCSDDKDMLLELGKQFTEGFEEMKESLGIKDYKPKSKLDTIKTHVYKGLQSLRKVLTKYVTIIGIEHAGSQIEQDLKQNEKLTKENKGEKEHEK